MPRPTIHATHFPTVALGTLQRRARAVRKWFWLLGHGSESSASGFSYTLADEVRGFRTPYPDYRGASQPSTIDLKAARAMLANLSLFVACIALLWQVGRQLGILAGWLAGAALQITSIR